MGTELGEGRVRQPDDLVVEGESLHALRRAAFAEAFTSEESFRIFYERALPRVFGYLLHRCSGDRALAEDLTQTVFVEALRHRRDFDGRADPVVWLTGIARHKLVDHLRSEARSSRRLLHLAVREIDIDPDTAAWRGADDRALLEAALARLPAEQRAVLILHHADALPVREVARLLHKSESATESLLSRSMAALRAVWEEAGHD
jgi:RNA polymerase sigma-70 factor (ECF subfamily)